MRIEKGEGDCERDIIWFGMPHGPGWETSSFLRNIGNYSIYFGARTCEHDVQFGMPHGPGWRPRYFFWNIVGNYSIYYDDVYYFVIHCEHNGLASLCACSERETSLSLLEHHC